MIRKTEIGMYRAEWLKSVQRSRISKVTGIFCPGHTGVRGNEWADKLAGLAHVEGKLCYDKNDIIRALWDKMWGKSEHMENFCVERMRLLGMTRGSGRHSTL